MSLKHRIVLMMLVLMALAITAADLVTTSEVHTFLTTRLDAQITDEQTQLVSVIDHVYSNDLHNGSTIAITNPQAWLAQANSVSVYRGVHVYSRAFEQELPDHIGPSDYVELIDNDGAVLYQHPIGSVDDPSPPPDLPLAVKGHRALSGSALNAAYHPNEAAFQAGSVGAPGAQYRISSIKVPGGIILVAESTGPTNTTLSSLEHIEILVSLVVMIVLALLVAWIVGLGLRPLEDMTGTAGAFAKGDLTRRVRFADERTEVGRLGGALNGMLVQIESAFAQRKESEERLRRFVADASHDLRTPLTSIRGYAELLRKGAFTEEEDRRRAIARIEHEADRMGVLVNDLLLLARLDQGRPVAHDPVELRPLVADAIAAARAIDSSRPISLDAPHGILVSGDAGRLRQAIDNLLVNAIVHTPEGTSISVKVIALAKVARLSVSDNGPGLTREEIEHVFDRFFQADPSRTGQGTGLGLSIVAAIAEAHGGRTWVQSVKGEGATFCFELPIDTTEENQAISDAPPLRDLEPTEGGERAGYGVGT